MGEVAVTSAEKRKATLVMVACALCWSVGGICIKMISWGALQIICCRSIITGLLILAYMKKRGMKFKVNKYALFIALGFTMAMTLFVFGNKLTTAANAIVIQYLCPVWVLLISAVILKKKVQKVDLVVVLICIGGIVLFFFDQITPGNMLGNVLSIFSGIGLAIMFVATSIANDSDTQYTGIVIGLAGATLVGLPGMLLEPFNPQPIEILFIFILGLFQLGVPYLIYPYAASRIKPLACSLISMIEPIANPIWVAIFYGEVPGMFALIGGVIIIVTTSIWCIWQNRQEE